MEFKTERFGNENIKKLIDELSIMSTIKIAYNNQFHSVVNIFYKLLPPILQNIIGIYEVNVSIEDYGGVVMEFHTLNRYREDIIRVFERIFGKDVLYDDNGDNYTNFKLSFDSLRSYYLLTK